MALAFPEGECFFDRSGLRVTARPDIYDANNPELFHSNMMIEYLWNVPDAIGDRDSNHPSGHTHPRATYTIVRNGVFSTSSTYGLATHRGFTIGFDVQGLIQLLPLPRQLRKDNVYASRLIKIVNRSNIVINSSSFRPDNPRTYLRAWDISWLTVANANFGLDLQWKPAQGGGWLENFFKNVLTMALGAIPIFGPILAVVFPVAWTLIVDPDSAFEELRNLMPGIDFADRLIRQRILDSVDESKQYLPDGWEQLALPAQKPSTAPVVDAAPPQPVQTLEEIGTSLSFVMAGEVLAQTNKVPPNDELVDEEGDSIVELVNPPTDFPDETSEAATLPSDG
ncbi:uncharacterized protein KY384_000379 [Bacidia gigantensis]|uniref:uncharacterized protein n=1 Tax=Bacidia gigantensis TaxID=2732470 RepID=UPI001D054DFE|nr:uncharacterized protein KY384_000379 [Bacidia gigantensis]KAG8526385.1 hypothetical protein KY384_000379 [Bacidia gigantensis]